MSGHNFADRHGKNVNKRRIGYRFFLSYLDSEEHDEFADVAEPRNFGARRPRTDEWGDYILEEQEWYIQAFMSGEIWVAPRKKQKNAD
jgi:hypothetical protein